MKTILKTQERVAFALRSLYGKYGYLPYKMSKFEAYDLYVANKDFLISDGVITFNDTDGKLLALKPDVTLSIIKNVAEGEKRKVFYNENVYRISGETKQFKEIMQAGLERVGDVGIYDIYEAIFLATASLAEISERFVLDISHLGILSALLQEAGAGDAFNRNVMRLLAEKNAHGIYALCAEYGVNEATTKKLQTIVNTYGNASKVLETLASICQSDEAKRAFDELSLVCALLSKTPYADRIRLDFSVVNDMNYYNGFVFKGFVDGISEGVLSGGQYDRLMARMGRKTGAIGFAVYLDLLEGFGEDKRDFDVDRLVLYNENSDLSLVAKRVEESVREGKSVSALLEAGKLRYQELVDLTKGGKND